MISWDAQADVYDLIRKFTMNHLELEVHITDEVGQPLAGAVLWFVDMPVQPRKGQALNAAILSRMAQRYARQSDFLNLDDIPGVVIERADLQGIYRDIRETGRYADNRYPYIFVATKRGYLPQVIEGAAPLNQRQLVTFKLLHDPQANVEPRMEEFDRLMAQAHAPVPGENLVGEARMIKVDELNQQTRALAQSLEKEGLLNEASAVYWALADFPAVIRTTSASGNLQAVGYRNGDEGPQAEADRVHATRINSDVPKLVINKIMMGRGFTRVGIYETSKGTAYLEVFDKIMSGAIRDQILPHDFKVAIRQALQWGSPDQACNLLQRAYRFEPAAMPFADWWTQLGDLQKRLVQLNLPAQACVIEGLPRFSAQCSSRVQVCEVCTALPCRDAIPVQPAR